MRILWIVPIFLYVLEGCASTQTTSTTILDPEQRQKAIDEVTKIAIQHCAQGIHGNLDYVTGESDLLVVGTAGEIVEGRPSLEEINRNYAENNIVVQHECENLQRWVLTSSEANIVLVEESLRTHASWPELTVNFPSQRTMLFERTEEGWKIRYYALAVRLPDDNLDENYAEPTATSLPNKSVPVEETEANSESTETGQAASQ